MLVLLTSQWRKRAAAILVALYALCLVAPAAAFAFSESPPTALCLSQTDNHQGIGESRLHESHVHQDGMDHHKSSPEKSNFGGDDHPGNCCGLFCVTAIAPPALGVTALHPMQASAVVLPAAESLFGRSSSRIDRPPRTLTSF
jgi:hypothetical protein